MPSFSRRVASHPRDVQQLWRRQNSVPDVQRVDPSAYQDPNGDRQLEASADTQLADQQQRAAVHRVQIRQLREEVQR
jgi:hypothetical protein